MARGRRDPNAEQERVGERNRQILEAAAKVFARKGYHRARTREIAEEAGVAEGTIYNYFDNKRELLLALIRRATTESMSGTLAHADLQDPRSLLTAVLRDRLEMLDRNRELIKAILPEMITDRELRREYFEEVVLPSLMEYLPQAEPALQTGELRPFDVRIVLPTIMGATAAAFMFNEVLDLPTGRVGSREELVTELVNFFMEGLRRHDGVARAGETNP